MLSKKELIELLLEKNKGHGCLSKTANDLNISRQWLDKLIVKLDINKGIKKPLWEEIKRGDINDSNDTQ